jgi:sugar phosphate isomerase/epimerase
VEEAGLRISSLQSILYQKPDLVLFGSPEQRAALHQHLLDCADLAAALGAEFLVFGAPKNRDRGTLSEEDAFSIALEFFAGVAPEFHSRGPVLVFEANPPDYGCNFATCSDAAASLVRQVGSPGFQLHLDTACMFMAGEDLAVSIDRHAGLLKHFHASEPHLGRFCHPRIPHRIVAEELLKSNYRGWVALEMRAADPPLAILECAVRYLHEVYRGEP